jgi:hypothetical protein
LNEVFEFPVSRESNPMSVSDESEREGQVRLDVAFEIEARQSLVRGQLQLLIDPERRVENSPRDPTIQMRIESLGTPPNLAPPDR